MPEQQAQQLTEARSAFEKARPIGWRRYAWIMAREKGDCWLWFRAGFLAARVGCPDEGQREALNSALYTLAWIAEHDDPACLPTILRTAAKGAEAIRAALGAVAASPDEERERAAEAIFALVAARREWTISWNDTVPGHTEMDRIWYRKLADAALGTKRTEDE